MNPTAPVSTDIIDQLIAHGTKLVAGWIGGGDANSLPASMIGAVLPMIANAAVKTIESALANGGRATDISRAAYEEELLTQYQAVMKHA